MICCKSTTTPFFARKIRLFWYEISAEKFTKPQNFNPVIPGFGTVSIPEYRDWKGAGIPGSRRSRDWIPYLVSCILLQCSNICELCLSVGNFSLNIITCLTMFAYYSISVSLATVIIIIFASCNLNKIINVIYLVCFILFKNFHTQKLKWTKH